MIAAHEALDLLDFLRSRIASLSIQPSTTDVELCRLELDLRQAAEIVHRMREDLAYERVRRNAESL
jgi:hypothetical protein